MDIHPDTPLTRLPGVGPQRGKTLEKLGLRTAGDLLAYFPRDYEDRRQRYTIRDAPLQGKVCVVAMAAQPPVLSRVRRGLDLVRLRAVDATGALYITFFNQSYMEHSLRAGEEYVFYGAVEEQGRRRSMTNPVVEPAGRQDATGCIMPVYRLTAGLSNHLLAGLVRRCLVCAAQVPETLPRSVRQTHALAAVEYALVNIHFPDDEQALALARRRLAFGELFYLSAGLALLKGRRAAGAPGRRVPPLPVDDFQTLLPFPLTAAQRRAMEEISADLASGRPMNRLLQGDVGSGKTAVAAFAAWLAARGGGQAALMAPTEVLAEQHARSLTALLSPAGVRVGLLTGSLPPAQKRRVCAALAAGELDLAVGTHALLSPGVEFRDLALIVADEQHRFGVAQRAALAAKGTAPHVLVMSATPIPRTLALIIYGDLDVSVLDELPPGRTPVHTYVIREDKRARMYAFVRKQVQQGRQVYIVCPAVEDSPDPAPGEEGGAELKAVTSYARQLKEEALPELTVAVLHGKLRPREKEGVMAAFAAGQTQVLVSTTVIEVGVDVPNAALMIVENADRFGLSQLHQLRGRVGRGEHESYCVLMTSTRSLEAMERLRALASTTDGFRIAEEDLKQRGPGDFFGSRQHGLPQMKLADLSGDLFTLHQAQQAAQALLAQDPQLADPENRPVLEQVKRLFSETPEIFN